MEALSSLLRGKQKTIEDFNDKFYKKHENEEKKVNISFEELEKSIEDSVIIEEKHLELDSLFGSLQSLEDKFSKEIEKMNKFLLHIPKEEKKTKYFFSLLFLKEIGKRKV